MNLAQHLRHLSLRAGEYTIEYSIPQAGHDRVFECVLPLTRAEAKRIYRATCAQTIFFTAYEDAEHRDTARELERRLNQAEPRFIHPVGIIFSIERAHGIGEQQ